jgi:putative transposase
VFLRLSYLAITGMITLLRLLPRSTAEKDIEILALRHQLAVLQRQIDKPQLTPPDRAFLACGARKLDAAS